MPIGSLNIVAHRCLGFGAPENSAQALRCAIQSTVDVVELDVRTASDGEFVVCHDPWFRGKDGRVFLVSRATSTELQESGILTLKAALSIYRSNPASPRLAIDVKVFGSESKLLLLLRSFGLADKVLIISWDERVLLRISRLAPETKLSHSFFQYLRLWRGFPVGFSSRPPKFVCDRLVPLESVNVVPRLLPLRHKFVKQLRETGVKVNVVSSGPPKEYLELPKQGVSGIFTKAAERVLIYSGLRQPETSFNQR